MICAVALHDVEPATFERCDHIRAWLAERGVDRLTLLVIPAADLHAFDRRSPALARWLAARVASGDAIAQHGFRHLRLHDPSPPRRWLARLQGDRAAEFAGLGAAATRDAVRTGRRMLADAGLEPRGFVAPAYAYSRALREELRRSFDWWADLFAVHRAGSPPLRAFARGLGSSGPVKRAASPAVARATGRLAGARLRIDVHPVDFEDARHRAALETLLARAEGRTMLTYDELVAA